MNSTHNITEELPETILEEAAIWRARLQDRGTDIELRQAFNIWFAADTRHRQAYEEMESLWGALETPVTQLMAEQSDHNTFATKTIPLHKLQQRPSGHRFQHLALASCLVLAITTAIGWQQDWATRWQSDYVTAIGEEMPFLTADNSRITLNTDSALAIDFTAERRQIRLFKGEAWFEVSSADKRPFIVATSAGFVQVTGTRFNVRLHQDIAIVSLDEGQVELHTPNNPNGSPVILSPGQQATLSPQGISSPSSFDHTAVTAWLRNQLVFYDTPLAEVVDTLNRHRHGHILITDQKLKTLKVSGVFSTDEPDTALDVMTSTLPVRLTRLTDYLVLIH